MAVPVFILIGLVLIVLQSTVFMFNPTWPAAPDLYYILIAFLAYRFDLLRGLLVVLPLSVAMDVVSGVILGTYPAVCFLGYALLKTMAEKMPVRESYYQVPFIGVSYLLAYKLVYLALSLLLADAIAAWSWPLMLLRVMLLVLFAFPLLKFFEWITTRLQHTLLPIRTVKVRPGNVFRPEGEE